MNEPPAHPSAPRPGRQTFWPGASIAEARGRDWPLNEELASSSAVAERPQTERGSPCSARDGARFCVPTRWETAFWPEGELVMAWHGMAVVF